MVRITKFYGNPWCSDCKISKAFLAEQLIEYDWINIAVDEKAAKFVEKINNGKRKIPTIEFSDGTYLVEPSNAELAEKLGLISKPSKDLYDILIVGSGPSGLTCAIYTAREGMDTLVVEKNALGGRMNYTERIENYPGFPEGITGENLALTFAKQAERFGVEMLKATEVVNIEEGEQCFVVKTSNGDSIKAKTVVISTGTTPRTLGVEGEADLLGYKIHFCSVCDGPFFKDKKVVVIGGGNSALEESLFLAQFATDVTIVEFADKFSATEVIQKEISTNPKIKTLTSYETKEFLVGDKKQLEGVRFFDRANQKEVILKPDGVFLFVGFKPNVAIAENLVDLDERGFIITDEKRMTSVTGIFATGDCRSNSTWQVASAVGDGAIVALKVRDYLRSH